MSIFHILFAEWKNLSTSSFVQAAGVEFDLAIHQVARYHTRASTNDILSKLLEEISPLIPDFKNGQALRSILQYLSIREQLASKVTKSEESAGYVTDSQNSILWFRPSETECRFTFRTRLVKTCPYVPSDEERRGTVRIVNWNAVLLKIRFASNNCVAFYFTCKVWLKIQTEGHVFVPFDNLIASNADNAMIPKPFWAGEHVVSHECAPFIIPIKLLECWSRGKIEDKARGLIVEDSTDEEIAYDSNYYPAALYRLFKALGPKVFDWLRDKGCISEENHEIITGRFNELGTQLHEDDAKRATEPGSQHDNGVCATNSAMTPLEEASEVSRKDREKLKIISTITKSHTYPEWAEILGLSGRGAAFGFLKRVKANGLITIIDTADGASVKLSEKGQRIIAF